MALKHRDPVLLCFDLGGVLIRICRSWQEACTASGLPVHELPAEFFERRLPLAAQYEIGRIDEADYYQGVSHATGGRYTPEEIERIHHAWTQCEYEGIPELMRELGRAPQLRLACLSNTNASHWRRLAPERPSPGDEYPSLAALEIKLASHLLGLAKPSPDIYRVAQERFDVRPEHIVFFDDLPDNVHAARAAGWDARRIDPFADTASQIRAYLEERRIL